MATKKLATQEEKLVKAIFRSSPLPRSTKTTRCMAKAAALAAVEEKLETAQRHVHKGRVGEARGILIHVGTWEAPTPKIKSSVKSALKMISPKKGISRYKMEMAILDARREVSKETNNAYRKCGR
jgi:hypothetical protein